MKSYFTNSQSSPFITVKPKYTESIINTFGIVFKVLLPFKFILLFVIVFKKNYLLYYIV